MNDIWYVGQKSDGSNEVEKEPSLHGTIFTNTHIRTDLSKIIPHGEIVQYGLKFHSEWLTG